MVTDALMKDCPMTFDCGGYLIKSKNDDRTWVDDLVEAFLAQGGEADLADVYDYIKAHTGRASGPSWLQNTRQRIYENSSDTNQFRGEDIFYSVGGLRSGRWGIRRKWLIDNKKVQPEPEDFERHGGLPPAISAQELGRRTWCDEIFDAIKANDGVACLSEIYEWIEKNAHDRLTIAWKTSVRRSLYDYSSDSEGYKGWKDLFYAVGGIGNGVWAIRTEWLEQPEPSPSQKGRVIMLGSKTPAVSIVSDDEDSTERIGRTTYSLKRNAKLARGLKEHYGFRCQVCEKKTRIPGRYYAEVHHIKPRNSHEGKDVWENMIVLCAQHHVEFDYGVLCIDPDRMCYVHRFDREVNGRPVLLKPPHAWNAEYVRYAKAHLFNPK